jgi:hypothetical protein
MIILVRNERMLREEYILAVHRVPTEAEFLRRAKVRPGTYAGRLMAKLYERLFERSLELKRDYTTYYAVEYGTFARYLRKRHLLSDVEAKELEKQFPRAATIVRFGWLYTFMQEGVGADLLAKLLDMEK